MCLLILENCKGDWIESVLMKEIFDQQISWMITNFNILDMHGSEQIFSKLIPTLPIIILDQLNEIYDFLCRSSDLVPVDGLIKVIVQFRNFLFCSYADDQFVWFAQCCFMKSIKLLDMHDSDKKWFREFPLYVIFVNYVTLFGRLDVIGLSHRGQLLVRKLYMFL